MSTQVGSKVLYEYLTFERRLERRPDLAAFSLGVTICVLAKQSKSRLTNASSKRVVAQREMKTRFGDFFTSTLGGPPPPDCNNNL